VTALAEALQACASGILTAEAGVSLLIDCGGWLPATTSPASSSPRITFRVAGQREQRELVRTASRLPAGAEIGQMRPDGSYWWIRIPAGPDAPQKTR